MPGRVEDPNHRCDYAEVFVELLDDALLVRKKAQEKTRTHQESTDVCSALLARQVTLAKHLAYTPACWTIHIAPLILRCMSDLNINLAWISQDPEPRSKLFVDYGLSQARQRLKHRRSLRANEGTDAKSIEHIEAAWMSHQRSEQLMDARRGSWSGKTAREMARDADCEELYDFEYVMLTRLLHIDWMHNLTLYPVTIGEHDPKSSYDMHPNLDEISRPNELYLATKMIIQTLNWYDRITAQTSRDVQDLTWFRDHIRLIDTSEMKESFSIRFTVQPISDAGGNGFQDDLTRSLAVITQNAISRIKLRIDRAQERFREPSITAVLVPLLGRLASLMQYSIGIPHVWNAHMAPIILRPLAEIMLSIMWLSGDIPQRSFGLIHASIIQARNDLKRLEKSLKERKFSSDVEIMRDFMKSRIESLERLFPHERDQQRVPNLWKMAKNANCINFYNIEMSEWSACVHSSWHHVGLHNLTYWDNPLYGFHRVPMVAPLECDIQYLRSAARICQASIEEIDKMLRINETQGGASLLEIFDEQMDRIQTMVSNHKGDSGSGQHRSDQSLYIHPVRREDHHISQQLWRLHAGAMRGDVETQVLLGEAHWNGTLPASDPSEAIRLLVQAAEQGNTHAQYRLACIHAQGPAEHRDLFKALVWLIRLTTLAEINTELEDKSVALRMAVSSELSVEQLTRARDHALGDAVAAP